MIMHFAMIKELQMLQLRFSEDELEALDPLIGPADEEVGIR
jgi:hypothetical protein